jgi:peptide/nickel transport system substrate-binding protein
VKRRASVILILLLLFCLLAGDDSLIYLRFSDATSLDPGKTRDQYSGMVTSSIFEGLVRCKTGTQTIEPCLARKWIMSPDGKKWIFYLRRGVYFHDGREFDTDAVIYSFRRRMERYSEYPKWKLFFPNIIRVAKLDKYTVEINLSRTFAPFLTALTDPVAFIVAPGTYDQEQFKPLGTGPFRFVSWEKGKSIILDRNDRYWEKNIRISRVIFKILKNPIWRIEQLKNGHADVLAIRSADEYNQFVGVRGVNIITTPSRGTFFLAFNTSKKPFNRLEVRRAFSHLIDKDVMIKQIFQNFASPANSPLPPHILGFHDQQPHHEFSIEKAHSLLHQAGYPNGFTCTIFFLKGDVGEQKIADIFARNASLIGVKIIKKPFPFEELFDKIKSREHDMIIRGWVAGPDPDIYLYSNFTQEEGNLNWAYYHNPRLVSLLQQAREELDSEKRIALYRKIQEIIYLEVPWIPLYHLNYLIVHRSNIRNLYFNSNSFLIFKDAYKF